MPSDTDPGVGVGLPIIGSSPGAPDPAILNPPVYTLLPLSRYAEIIGINPIQFYSGIAPALFPNTGCTDRWFQYDFQHDGHVSRDAIAREIQRAERDIAVQLGYWPFAQFIEDESVNYPRFYRREYYSLLGKNSRGQFKMVKVDYGKFLSAGKRAVTLVGNVATTGGGGLSYSDEDGDGYEETANITAPTALTNPAEIKVYIQGKNGDHRWEVRPIRNKSISGGFFRAKIDAWLLFRPELLMAFPGQDGMQPLQASLAANYVTTLDVYREFTDPAEQSTLIWDASVDKAKTQVAFIEPKDPEKGTMYPIPATYNSGTMVFTKARFVEWREPDRLLASYRGGLVDVRNGSEIMPDDMAMAIAYMATARLSRPLCTTCENVRQREKELSKDLKLIQSSGEEVAFIPPMVTKNPFGTRVGEVEAWKMVLDRRGEASQLVSAFVFA